MLSVTERTRRTRVVEVWQHALRIIGRQKDSEFIERWKLAPLFIAFCEPCKFEPFGWVAAEQARVYSIQEVGTAVRSIELKALEHGIGLHGIMGLLKPEIRSSRSSPKATKTEESRMIYQSKVSRKRANAFSFNDLPSRIRNLKAPSMLQR